MIDAAARTKPDLIAALCWPLAAMLLALFVNAFPAWSALNQQLGRSTAWVPFALLLVVMLPLLALAWRRRPWHWPALLAGLFLTLLGLAVSDPAFPAKRIHVAEYALLALVLRRALVPWLSGWRLTYAAGLIGLLAGLHDEMIQGLLPSRSYGLRDVGVDGLGALAGSLVGHGLHFARGHGALERWAWRDLPWPLLPLVLGVILLAGALPGLAGYPIPLWTVAPLLAGGAVLLLHPPAPQPSMRFVLFLVLLFTMPLTLYPLLSNVPPLVFR